MKKYTKSALGVTLLEIMLVLAIAAMIIVMSVRYYQSATANQQANATLQMIQGITAAADSLSQATGSYSAAPVTTSTITPLMPNQLMTSPWGGDVTVASTAPNIYTTTFVAMPEAVCVLVNSRLGANPKFNVTSTCPTGGAPGDFTYEYNSQN